MSIKKILLAFFCFATVQNYAQEMIGDTITIYIENKVELKLAIYDFEQLKDSSTFITKHLDLFQKDLTFLALVPNGLKPEEAEKVVYIPGEKIVLRRIPKKEIFQIDGIDVINTGFRDHAELRLGEATVYITTDNLEDISDLDLANSVVKMIDSLPNKTRVSLHQFYQLKDGKITVLQEKEIRGNAGDQLELSFDAGANLIKNQLVGDVSFMLGVTLFKKGQITHRPYANLSLMYDFPNNEKMNINMFLNFGYDFYNKGEASFGLEYGFLVRKQGDFFDDGTTRLGIFVNTKSDFNLAPSLYFDRGFKKAYPGLRIGWAF